MRDFLDIILEAPTPDKKSKDDSSDKTKATDYTSDDGSGSDDETTATDYTDDPDLQDDDSDSDSGDDSDDAGDGDGDTSPTDYTEQDDESDPSTDGSDADGSTDGDTDDTTDDTGTDETEQDPTEAENNRILLDDFANFFHLIKNTLSKLSNIDKSNILINKIATQITTNLNVLKKQIFDYITFSFPKGKYVANLYKYNYFLEAFKINVEMLKKISVFIPN